MMMGDLLAISTTLQSNIYSSLPFYPCSKRFCIAGWYNRELNGVCYCHLLSCSEAIDGGNYDISNGMKDVRILTRVKRKMVHLLVKSNIHLY